MTKPVAFKQADVTRFYRGAMKAGIPMDRFKLTMENGQPVLLPIAANETLDEAADLERRMKDAFGR